MREEEIVAWVESHLDSLPTTLAEIARYPVPFRKVIVCFVSREVRLRLWREHLETFVGDASQFSREQQAFIAEAVESLPALLAAPAPNPLIVEWEARAARLFSRQESRRTFGLLGPPEPPGGLPLPADARPEPA